jgi:hypothetical protein
MALRGGQFETVAIPKRLELQTAVAARGYSFSTDSFLSNAFLEKDPNDGQMWVRKRPGFSGAFGGAGAGAPAGIYTFRNTTTGAPIVLSIVGTGVYRNVTGSTLLGNMSANAGTFRFETVNYTGLLGSRVAVIGSNSTTNAYYTDGTTFSQIIDPDFPTSRVIGWAFLDDTLYVMTPEADIRGSGIADPTTWDPLNTIAARDDADFGVGIARHMSYVVALKEQSIQFFYNAGNPSGSPLKRLPGSKLSFGCAHGATVQDIDGELFFIGVSRGVVPFAMKLVNLQPVLISNEAVNRILASGLYNFGGATWISFVLRVGGHRFYVVSSTIGDFTLAYDLQYNTWYRWTSPTGGMWTPLSAAYDLTGLASSTTAQTILQDSVDAGIHICNIPEATYGAFGRLGARDNDVVFPVDIYTQNYDFGTTRSKQLSAMYFTADQIAGTNLQVRYSDDDRQTWSNFREVPLGVAIPSLHDCGSFAKRAWHFRHVSAEPFRLKTSDMQLDIGTL